MIKFKSKHSKLGVLARSLFQTAYLNRQIICLLSDRGIPDRTLLSLQHQATKNLKNMLIFSGIAINVIKSTYSTSDPVGSMIINLISSGFSVTEHPFVSRFLQTLSSVKLREIKTRARIIVPQGASLIVRTYKLICFSCF